ncbi:MAG TPA: hypothetical protein VNN09_11015 [Candidatus Competibacteraceae bacterium]|nr:hypothetical protein [Candidatus Competibacteraceae bacterium]
MEKKHPVDVEIYDSDNDAPRQALDDDIPNVPSPKMASSITRGAPTVISDTEAFVIQRPIRSRSQAWA